METMQNENKVQNPAPKPKNEPLHWLMVGGILSAIGLVSALVLTALNLVTDPVIQNNNAKKQLAGYRAIYANCQAVSDPVAIDNNANLAEYYQAYSDEGKTQLIGYIYNSKTIAVKSYGNIHAMVGISSEGDNPVLGKVYLVEDSLSYKNTFETGYVEPYNANPSDETLAAVKCGATYGATALNEIITAAKAYDPARITRYVTTLANLFHKFYNAHRVAVEDKELMMARVSLCIAVKTTIGSILKMFKITAPEKM